MTPAIKPCSIVSGLLKNLGKAIAHHLVMDRSGFPFLSPTFYYLVGKEDIAITLLDVDVSGEALHVIKKVLITCIHVIHVQYLDESSDKLVDDEDDWKVY